MLMADMVLDGKLKVLEDGGAVMAEGETLEEMQNRLFNCCWFFLLYCHNSGFDPQPYIEALMGEFEAAFSYQDLLDKYQEDIKKGIQLRTVFEKDDNES